MRNETTADNRSLRILEVSASGRGRESVSRMLTRDIIDAVDRQPRRMTNQIS